MLKKNHLQCWIVTENLAGTRNQCLGVTDALGLEPKVKTITLNQPWRTFSPYLGFEYSGTFNPKLEPPWPDLLITSGRKAIAAARYIRMKSQNKTFCVHIQDPRINPNQFDLVAVPAHDPTRGDNVIVTRASPNRITADKLENAKTEFPEFGNFPEPKIAVLIGGNSKAYTLTSQNMRALAEKLQRLEGKLMVTTSRRTGEENEQILREALKDTDAYIWDGHGKNPYIGLLAWADYILVTADSASMISEACSTGKPTYMIPMEGGKNKKIGRLDKLHHNLQQSGVLRVFEGKLEPYSYEPLGDAAMVAGEIEKRLRE